MNNHGVYAININSTCGLFAAMQIYAYILMHCEEKKLIPYVLFTGDSYWSPDHQANWFENYFYNKIVPADSQKERIKLGQIRFSTIKSAHDLYLRDKYHELITIEQAHRLFQKYIGIHEDIIHEVDRFVAGRFRDRQVLGIHYRGTDKVGEAPPVSWERVGYEIARFLSLRPEIDVVFVATDQLEFIRYLNCTRLPAEIACYNNKQLYQGNLPPHRYPHSDKYQMGREAVINCLILSRCTYCMKTASYLSGWAKVINPELPVIMLNKPYDHALWFPDAEIWRAQCGLSR